MKTFFRLLAKTVVTPSPDVLDSLMFGTRCLEEFYQQFRKEKEGKSPAGLAFQKASARDEYEKKWKMIQSALRQKNLVNDLCNRILV